MKNKNRNSLAFLLVVVLLLALVPAAGVSAQEITEPAPSATPAPESTPMPNPDPASIPPSSDGSGSSPGGVDSAPSSTDDGNGQTALSADALITQDLAPLDNPYNVRAQVGSVATLGGGYATGTTIDLASDAPGATLYYTTDGSDPVTSGGAIPYTGAISLTAPIRLRVAIVPAGGVIESTGIDYIFTPTTAHYTNVENLYDYAKLRAPGLYTDTPEIQYNIYRFDDNNTLGVSSGSPGGWEVKSYNASFGVDGKPGSERGYSGQYMAYTGANDGAELKTDRFMLFGGRNTTAQHALSFWIWMDDTYTATDGVYVNLYLPGDSKEALPLFFPVKNTTAGWQQCFIDLAGLLVPDSNGPERFGFGIVGTGANPIYIDEAGVVNMAAPPANVAYPASMSGGRIFYGEDISISFSGIDTAGVSTVSQPPYPAAPYSFDALIPATSLDIRGGFDEAFVLYRPQTGSGSPTQVGATGFLTVPVLSSRPVALYEYDSVTGTRRGEVDFSNSSTTLAYPADSWFELSSGDIDDPAVSANVTTTIWYTADGSSPLKSDGTIDTAAATQYTGPIQFTGSTICLNAVAVGEENGTQNALLPSDVGGATISLPTAETVTADVPSGTVAAGTTVALSCATPGSSIYYSIDGTTPTKVRPGLLYTAPIPIAADTVITAVSWSADFSEGPASTFRYELTAKGDIFEPNNSASEATALSFPFQINATLHQKEDVDYYAFDFSGGRLELKLTQPDTAGVGDNPYNLTLCDAAGNSLHAGESGPNQVVSVSGLAAGRYTALVSPTAAAPESLFGAREYTLTASSVADTAINFSEMNMVAAMNSPGASAGYSGLRGWTGAETLPCLLHTSHAGAALCWKARIPTAWSRFPTQMTRTALFLTTAKWRTPPSRPATTSAKPYGYPWPMLTP